MKQGIYLIYGSLLQKLRNGKTVLYPFNNYFLLTELDSLIVMQTLRSSSLFIFSFVAPWCSGSTSDCYSSNPQSIPTTAYWKGTMVRHGVLGSHDGEALWLWSLLEIRLLAVRRSTTPQKQFNHHHHHHLKFI